ncbi:MAG: DUF2849 domain-containing protein [Pseudomonadota bacterium]
MPKPKKPQVVTANDLIEGDSVFLGIDGWVRDIALARVAHSPEEFDLLEAEGARAEADNLIVGPYLVAVDLIKDKPWPVLRREQIRAARQPTIAVGPAAVRLVGAQAASAHAA